MQSGNERSPEGASMSFLDSLKRKAPFVAIVLLGVFLALGILTFAGPCVHDDGSASICYAASRVVAACGIIATIVGVAGILFGNDIIGRTCAVFAALSGLCAAIALGTFLPLCMLQTMRCWTAMRPFAMACGIAIALCAVVQIVLISRRR